MNKGKLVILIGIDGSGKSSLLSTLKKEGYFTSHWRKLKSFSLPKPLNFENPAEEVQELQDQKRLEFIWSYIRAEWEYLIKPTLETGRNVISDGFFIRFYVKERIYKRLPVDELLKYSPLTGQELIIMVDLPPEVAFQRKISQGISVYECFNGPNDFVRFQSFQRKALLEYAKNFPHVIVEGILERKKLAKRVLEILAENRITP